MSPLLRIHYYGVQPLIMLSKMDLTLGGSKKKQLHVRKKYSIITLDLFKPTKKSYPEFDYAKICKEYLNEDESSGEDERFHDREAEDLVRRLEQKYSRKKDKHGRKIRFGCADDYMDKTVGYDLTDPFIDDSEAYDEHVPSVLDTARGGFYVNRGKLEFKSKYAEDDSDSEVDETIVKKKAVEKRRRISSDEEGSETKRVCTSPSSKLVSENNASTDLSKESAIQEPVRLSSSGAAPTTKQSDVSRNNLFAQQYIKKRRLLGHPPMAKINQSLAVKAALNVKKKLKPQAKKAVSGMTDDDLAGFLKDMVGGEIEPIEEMETIISDEKEHSTQNSTDANTELEIGVDKFATPSVEKGSSQSVSTASAPLSTAAVNKRSPGRPPGSIQLKPMPLMSDKLRLMIDSFKQKTKAFGAPNKKIRLPPSLVDLCLRIEEQCMSECFNHQQRTRVFDQLANWVCVQRNSLYIRMRAHRDRHEPNATSDSDINVDEPMNNVKEVITAITDEVMLPGSSDSPSSAVTNSSSSAISDTLSKSPVTFLASEKELRIGLKDIASNDVTRSAKQSTETVGDNTVKPSALPNTSNAHFIAISTGAIIIFLQSGGTTKVASSSKIPPAVNAPNSLSNTQLLSLFATIVQQARSDPIRQHQRVADSLSAQINAAFHSTKQHSEFLTQYQLTLNNLAKIASIPSATLGKNMASVQPDPTKSNSQLLKPQTHQNELERASKLISNALKGPNQMLNEKAARTLKEINSGLAHIISEIEKALMQTEKEYIKEKLRAEKEGKTSPSKHFIWSDSLRTALKRHINLLFTNLEQQADPNNSVNYSVVQYLYHTIQPLFKDYVKFRDLMLEIFLLCPERRHLILVPEMKTYIELNDISVMQSLVSNSSCSSVVCNPKLTQEQKIMLVRENKERERLMAEQAAAEKEQKGHEEIERNLQAQRIHEESENRKRDEEAIKKWEEEETIHLETSKEEDEILENLQPEKYLMWSKDSDPQENNRVGLDADTEVEMNTEEDKGLSGGNFLSKQSSQDIPAASCSTHTASFSRLQSSPISRITHLQAERANNSVCPVSSSFRQSSLVNADYSERFMNPSESTVVANFPPYSETHHRSTLRQQPSSLVQAIEDNSAGSSSQITNDYQISSQQQQSSWTTRQSTVCSTSAPTNRQVPVLYPSHSSRSAPCIANAALVAQEQCTYPSYQIQHSQISYSNMQQSQRTPAICHSSQISRHFNQEPEQLHHPQHPCRYRAPVYNSTSVQKTTPPPPCGIPQHTPQNFGNVVSPSEQVIYAQQISSGEYSSPSFPSVLQQPISQQQRRQLYNHRQQQFLSQQERQEQLYNVGQQRHNSISAHHQQMYNRFDF
ncbi:unnamed protein product [Thelazia callipaeda]|uniref:HUN domain-containing protein n=1 Tax=Thelazia callipaeda TaxID=103827 RepID=A0A158RCI8_THECL|nr:unnamed protein product [Thelazia callipaeda]